MTNYPKALCVFCLALLLLACEDDDTEAIKSTHLSTDNLYASYQLSSTGEGYTDIFVQFQLDGLGSNTYVDLVKRDRVWFTTGPSIADLQIEDDIFAGLPEASDNYQKLKENERTSEELTLLSFTPLAFGPFNRIKINETWYTGRLYNDDPATAFRVELQRGFFSDAVDSRVQLPPGFQITAPAASDILDPANDLVIQWGPTNPSGTMDIQVTQNCTGSTNTRIFANQNDDGEYSLTGGTFSAPPGECQYSIQLERSQTGTLDSHLAGGIITTTQVRRITTR